jgi:hypothetical protein
LIFTKVCRCFSEEISEEIPMGLCLGII